METDSKIKTLKERLDILPEELKGFILSAELPRKINLLSRKYNLSERQESVLQNEITFILLLLDSVDSMPLQFVEGLGLTQSMAEALAQDVWDHILRTVEQYVAHTQDELVATPVAPTPAPSSSSQPSAEGAAANIPSKTSLMEQIEKPFKTVIKKYIIEYDHKPIQDTSHLIDDKVDEVPKLQEHYND